MDKVEAGAAKVEANAVTVEATFPLLDWTKDFEDVPGVVNGTTVAGFVWDTVVEAVADKAEAVVFLGCAFDFVVASFWGCSSWGRRH